MSAEIRPSYSPAKTFAWLAVIFAAVAGLSLISIHLPLGRDQGVAAYFGWQVLNGKAVYRELYHFNFPGIFLTYALAFKTLGLSVEAVNAFDLVFRIFTLAGVFLAGRRLFGTRSALWAAGIYGLTTTVVYNNYWLNAQKETFALGALVFCLYFFAMGMAGSELRKKWLFLAGVCAAWAMLYKPTVALAPGLASLFLLLHKEFKLKDRGLGFASFTAGAIFLSGAVLAWLASAHSLPEMARQVFIFGSNYGGQYYTGGWKVLGLAVWKLLRWAIDFGFLAGFGLLGAALLARSKDRGFKLVFWFGLGLFLNLMVQLKFFVYHFMVLALPLSLFAGAFFGEQLSELLPSRPRTAKTAVLILAAFLFASNLRADFGRYGRELLYDFGMISREDFLERYGRWGAGDISALASSKVARYLREQTGGNDKVLVFGLEPGLNFLSRRPSPTRFCYDLPLVYQSGGDRFKNYQAGIRKEFLDELGAGPPAYIVVIEKDTNTVEPGDSFGQMLEFVEFRDFIGQNYYLETKIEHYYLYRRK